MVTVGIRLPGLPADLVTLRTDCATVIISDLTAHRSTVRCRPTERVCPGMDPAMIEFKSVTKQYQGGSPAVDSLTMSIDKGSITVFVGPSGCGKTASLRMINAMVEQQAG